MRTNIRFLSRAALYSGNSKGPNVSRSLDKVIAGWSGGRVCTSGPVLVALECALFRRSFWLDVSSFFAEADSPITAWSLSSSSSMRWAAQYSSKGPVFSVSSTVSLEHPD